MLIIRGASKAVVTAGGSCAEPLCQPHLVQWLQHVPQDTCTMAAEMQKKQIEGLY